MQYRYGLFVAMLALGAAACGDGATTVVAEQELCDGSAQARLTYAVAGGFVDSTYSFSGVYGHSFFVIDGACRFWAGGDPLSGVRTGTLSADQGRAIANDTHFAQIPALSAHRDTESCPDAGDVLLGAAGTAINCTCGCEANFPREIGQAFAKATQIHTQLMTTGAAFDGSLRAASLSLIGAKADPPPAMTLAWPLPWSPSTIAFGQPITADAGRLIEVEAERVQLRQLRSMAATVASNRNILVRTADGAFFSLFVRDEPPDHVRQAVSTLLSP